LRRENPMLPIAAHVIEAPATAARTSITGLSCFDVSLGQQLPQFRHGQASSGELLDRGERSGWGQGLGCRLGGVAGFEPCCVGRKVPVTGVGWDEGAI